MTTTKSPSTCIKVSFIIALLSTNILRIKTKQKTPTNLTPISLSLNLYHYHPISLSHLEIRHVYIYHISILNVPRAFMNHQRERPCNQWISQWGPNCLQGIFHSDLIVCILFMHRLYDHPSISITPDIHLQLVLPHIHHISSSSSSYQYVLCSFSLYTSLILYNR